MPQAPLPFRGRSADKAEAFHARNPHVLARLHDLALGLLMRGHVRYSVKGLFEIIRFEEAMRTTGMATEGLKLNNDLTASYARMLMEEDPRLAGFFETRLADCDLAGGAVPREPERADRRTA